MTEGDTRAPRATVIICTRDRAGELTNALASVVAACGDDIEVLVVDQSGDHQSRAVVDRLAGSNPSVTYLRGDRVGLSAARNQGASMARSDLLLFVDDDCTIEAGWAEAWVEAFAANPTVGIAFGTVTYPVADSTPGFVSEFTAEDATHGIEIFSRRGHVGIGANMALSAAALRQAGPFDERLGAGTGFPAAEELDMAYRVVRAGYRLGQVSRARVWHHGHRPGEAGKALYRGYVVGTAAMQAKHARCRDGLAARLVVVEVWDRLAIIVRGLLTGSRPLGVRTLLAYVGGLARSMALPVDSSRRLYRPRGRDQHLEAIQTLPARG